MKVIISTLIIIICYIIWQHMELKKFEVTSCQIHSDKIAEPMKLVMISDLHSHVYGKNNEPLFRAVAEQKPDLILIPGDMIVGKKPDSYDTAYEAFAGLVPIAPVYFCNGNHESRPAQKNMPYTAAFLAYEKKVKALGVHILNNKTSHLNVGENKITISGAEVDIGYYAKGKRIPLPEGFLVKKLGMPGEDYHILLAHNPAYSEQYASWGADLTFCGHNHGGLIRIPGLGSVISPQLELFPKYDAGEFVFGKKHVLVGRGLGTHTFHIRIFNRAQLVAVELLPQAKKK